jgi:putative transposase
MPRKLFTPSSDAFYNLGGRSNNRDWFTLPLDTVYRIMGDYLYFIHHAFDAEIFSFVLMANHFHLIAKFPQGNLSEAMNYFMRETSRVIAFESGRINHVYGTRIFRSELRNFRHFENCYKYIYRNPVEAGLCERVEEYPYSTLRGLLGQSHLAIPVACDPFLFGADGVERTLAWLNTEPSLENRMTLKKSLRLPVCRYPRIRRNNRVHPLEAARY